MAAAPVVKVILGRVPLANAWAKGTGAESGAPDASRAADLANHFTWGMRGIFRPRSWLGLIPPFPES